MIAGHHTQVPCDSDQCLVGSKCWVFSQVSQEVQLSYSLMASRNKRNYWTEQCHCLLRMCVFMSLCRLWYVLWGLGSLQAYHWWVWHWFIQFLIYTQEGEEGHARRGWTMSRCGQDSPWKIQSEWQRTEINLKSTSMVWPTLGSRTAKEQNRTYTLYSVSWLIYLHLYKMHMIVREITV